MTIGVHTVPPILFSYQDGELGETGKAVHLQQGPVLEAQVVSTIIPATVYRRIPKC